jgi:acetyl-CoA carboxylase biotin carboxyl carrier protein
MRSKQQKAGSSEAVTAGVDWSEVERLLEFMSRHGLEEFEYAHGDLRIRLKKPVANSNSAGRSFALPEIVVAHPGPPATEAPAAPGSAPEAATEAGLAEDTHLIKSPIVGTFYEGSNPGAAPFVKVGDSIKAGQVLCIIEAMKLMNEIESEVAGEVARIFVENGQPVEYGETLFAIHPTRKK